jgi:hypothetical protein
VGNVGLTEATMRKIEKEMYSAIVNGYNWSKGNTKVMTDSDTTGSAYVYLHGNHIATVRFCMGMMTDVEVNKETLAKWPTPTTKSRLRALGVNVTTKNDVTYLNGVAV